MKAFMDKDFMLQSATAQHLYHDYAAGMPICDYHCHIPPREKITFDSANEGSSL